MKKLLRDRLRLKREAMLRLRALRVGLGLAARFLGRRLEGAQAAHFIHDALGFEFALQTLERAIDGLTFADDYFWHGILSGLVG